MILRYKGNKHVTKTVKYRLKTSRALTNYFDSMYSESHIWLNVGIKAKQAGILLGGKEGARGLTPNLMQIPQAWAHGAIQTGYEMDCSHVKYGKKVYPL